MKKWLIILSFVIIFSIPVSARADKVDITRISNYFQGGFHGGEFTVVIKDRENVPDLEWVLSHYIPGKTGGITSFSFQTFCVETAEIIGSNLIWAISQNAIMGRKPPYGDPISLGTAWLYTLFVKGMLPGYNYTPGPGRAADAKLLQETIWWLEGEGGDPGSENKFRQLVLSKFGSLGEAIKDNNRKYPVAVLNVWAVVNGNQILRQDQLVYVPEPGLLILLGIGITGVGILARRYRKI